jgi:polar amino acid transport system substrate-binding protein
MMDKRKPLVIWFCLFLLISFAGCIGPEETLDPTIKRIKDAGKLLVGTHAPYAPMEYFDENGDIIGFDIDIAEMIAEKLDVELEIKNHGEVDMIIAAITITTERAEQVLFSNAYLNAGQVIIVNEFNQNISIPDDLENKSVGVQSGTTSEAEALKYTNSSLVKVYDHYLEARADLIAGEIDAIIIDYPAGLGLIKNISGLKIVGEPFTDELYGIAVKKGEQALKTEIDDLIASSEIKELEAKWF